MILQSDIRYAGLARRYAETVERIREAEAKYRRTAGSVMLVPAVKYADAGMIGFLYLNCGLRDIGENRIQTMREHLSGLGECDGLRVHFIGTLQKNKVKYAVGKTVLIHSLDSAELADEIDKRSAAEGLMTHVLIEINSGGEDSKSGVLPADAERLAEYAAGLDNLSLDGFMTMGPRCDVFDGYYTIFAKTAVLADGIWSNVLHRSGKPLLSMGMTDSFEAAVAAGADIVRIGKKIFSE